MTLRRRFAVATALAATVAVSGPAIAEELVEYTIVDGVEIPKALTDKAGDPENGRKVAIDRKLGNCLACHQIAQIPEQPFHGNIGPELSDVGARLTPAEIRLQIVNSRALNPDSAMPAFYKVEGINQVKAGFEGKPILDAQQIEDVIAYLETLKGAPQGE